MILETGSGLTQKNKGDMKSREIDASPLFLAPCA
ncbi:hypothetical protein MiSe_38490 [Microseira wollei NIES-4236]|uniref:Uncharacterized protein n=1 Tax=Microseira wollei NIES-4236 TaxID=2530354 RepID=A0AAV3XCF5_9CYAN|nr:hypothetical protein MiSe_38490 [Microseira wollei NIES-4236]